MKKFIVGIMLCAIPAITFCAQKQLPQKQWELSGFANPESVLADSERGCLYVSNVNGNPTDKDGNGFISKVKPDGTIESLQWVKGLHAPKGMALSSGNLYVTDIDRIAIINPDKGSIISFIAIPGSEFLNDASADADGNVYFSEMTGKRIYRLSGKSISVFAEGDVIGQPNGLLVKDGFLYVVLFQEGSPSGYFKKISLSDRSVSTIKTTLAGNLDGLALDTKGNFIVSDWVAGKIYKSNNNNVFNIILTLKQGSADIFVDQSKGILYVPSMVEGKVISYKLQ